MIISHNMAAYNAQRQYHVTTGKKGKSMEKLSSGYRVNRAADDAAALSISEKLRWQVRGLDRACNNIQDGASLVQLTDGALSEAESILQRARELAVQAANDTNTDLDRSAIQAEIDQCVSEFNRIAETTHFNGIYPLRPSEEYALDGVTTKNQTPTAVEKGVYHMDDPELQIMDPSGNPKKTIGFAMDFAATDPSQLDGKTFFLTCSQYCSQTFEFGFKNGGGDSVNVTKLDGRTNISVAIDINGKTGAQIPDAIAQQLDQVNAYDASLGAKGSGNYQIGHANSVYIDGSKMVFYPTDGSSNYAATSYSKTVGSGGTQKTYTGLNMGTIYLNDVEDLVSISTTANTWGLKIQSGALAYQEINIPLHWMEAKRIGIDPLDVSDFQKAGGSIAAVDHGLDWLNSLRSEYGAIQNRLEHAGEVDSNTSLNTSAAESRMRDTDMASEMVNFSKESILASVGEAMMSQANQIPDSILKLLQ